MISDGSFELGSKIDRGNDKILAEVRNVNSKLADVDKRMDDLTNSVALSGKKTNQELKYLRGLSTRTHIDVELMKKKWNFNVTDDEREKYMKDLVAAGKAGPDYGDDE